MAKLDLNPGDRALLLVLMTIGTRVANADLNTQHGIDLKKDRRDKLESLHLIKTATENRRVFLELTADGRNAVLKMFTTAKAPVRGLQAAAFNALLMVAGRYHERTGVTPAELFGAGAVDLDSEAIEDRIRKAYNGLATRPGQWVTLTALRELLGGIPRERVDAVLVAMNRTSSVTIVPESNQKALTEEDRAAAVMIGNQPKHSIAIGHR